MRISMSRFGILFAAAAASSLAGCATDQGSGVREGVSVTRFHLNQPIARGVIAIEAADMAEANSLAFQQMIMPVARELDRLGWTSARDPESLQVAVVRVAQGRRQARSGGSSISIGFGGGTGGWSGSGVGVGVGGTIPVGGSGPIVVTQMEVRIQRRSDGTVAWEGRSEIEAREGTPLADPRNAADRLAIALFQDFPGESGRTIRAR